MPFALVFDAGDAEFSSDVSNAAAAYKEATPDLSKDDEALVDHVVAAVLGLKGQDLFPNARAYRIESSGHAADPAKAIAGSEVDEFVVRVVGVAYAQPAAASPAPVA